MNFPLSVGMMCGGSHDLSIFLWVLCAHLDRRRAVMNRVLKLMSWERRRSAHVSVHVSAGNATKVTLSTC